MRFRNLSELTHRRPNFMLSPFWFLSLSLSILILYHGTIPCRLSAAPEMYSDSDPMRTLASSCSTGVKRP